VNALELQAVDARLGGRRVLAGATLAVRSGELLGVIGPNGAGKSSLLRVMAGLLEPAAGAVRLDGRALADWPMAQRGREIAWLAQGAPVHWPLSVRAVVELGRLPYRTGWFDADTDGEQAIGAAMRDAEVGDIAGRLVTELSGGERARVMLARVLAGTPRLILADEPVAALDAYHQLQVMELLAARAAAGAAVVVVLHDLGLAARFCPRVVLLDEGRVVADGAAREVLQPAVLEPVYRVEMRVLEQDGLRAVLPWRRLGVRS
jgi:iron complex transport system ATP-binding protein